jgi:hypothetical protein
LAGRLEAKVEEAPLLELAASVGQEASAELAAPVVRVASAALVDQVASAALAVQEALAALVVRVASAALAVRVGLELGPAVVELPLSQRVAALALSQQKVAVAEIRLGITLSHPDRVATLLAEAEPREAQPKRPAVAEAPA